MARDASTFKNPYILTAAHFGLLSAALFWPCTADAYVGPGAGFAVLGSFAVIFVTMILAGVSLLAWPFRMLWRTIRRRSRSKPLIRRLIVVGFDGQEPRITERLMAEGRMPNFSKLAGDGRLQPSAFDLSVHHPGRVVVLHHRYQPRQAQHLRFPRPRSPHLPAAAVVDRDRLGRPGPQDRQAADPARQTEHPQPPEIETVVDHPRRAQHLVRRSSGCRSPSRPTNSTAPSSARCASPTCSAPRAPSCSSPPVRAARHSRRAVCASSSGATVRRTASRAPSKAPGTRSSRATRR